jgi:hypothetical protein
MTTPGACATLSSATALPASTPELVIGTDDPGVRLAAAKAAGAHAFIAELPEGYRTPVGEGGVVLTSGQRLRLSVAAVIAADPASVVVDDPTAGLDPSAEAAALPGLESLFRGREVNVVSASPAVLSAIARANGDPAGRGAPRSPTSPPEDPGLPSLGRLLDAREMTPLLSSMLDGGCLDVRVHSTRYKPGKNIVVQYGVRTSTGWSTAVAYASAEADLERKSRKLAHRGLARRVTEHVPNRRSVGYLPEVAALVQWMPLDVRLPILGDDAERLARRLAKKDIRVGDVQPELLRYWARRRGVLRFGPHVLKVYRDRSDFDHALHGLRVARKLSRVSTPAYEAGLKARRTTVQRWVPGATPSLAPAKSDAAGRLLADLHADRLLRVPTTTPHVLLRKATSRAAFLEHVVPTIRDDVRDLLVELTLRQPEAGPPVTSHGNFHGGQLLEGPDGLTVIDVDRLCRASPAYDIATFAAHLAFGRPGDRDVLDTAVDSLVRGYGSRPADLGWYLSVCVLRRAAVPFRFQDERWPQATTELVALAREVLR